PLRSHGVPPGPHFGAAAGLGGQDARDDRKCSLCWQRERLPDAAQHPVRVGAAQAGPFLPELPPRHPLAPDDFADQAVVGADLPCHEALIAAVEGVKKQPNAVRAKLAGLKLLLRASPWHGWLPCCLDWILVQFMTNRSAVQEHME